MRIATLLAALVISTSAAIAQTPAVKSPNANNPSAPVPGANSFTEGQAKEKIEFQGLHAGLGPHQERRRHLDWQGHEGRQAGQCESRLSRQRNRIRTGSMTKVISKLYPTYDRAQAAVRELEAAGVPHSDISIVANNSDNWVLGQRHHHDEAGRP